MSPPHNRTIVQGETCDDEHKTCLAGLPDPQQLPVLVISLSGSLSGSKHGLQDCGDVYGDRLLCSVCVRLDPGLFHHAH